MSQRILLAGGGTAGHIEPALAVADAIRKINPELVCEFLGTNGALEQMLVPKRGYQLHTINKVVMPRSLAVKNILFPFQLALSITQALRTMRGVSLLIGFGGYVSAPAYLSAFLRKIPIVIHEANAKPGWANKLGRRFAQIVAVNFDSVRREWPGSVLTGMPIRESISALNNIKDKSEIRARSCQEWGLDPKRPIVAVFGGSQGSLHINQVIKQSLENLSEIQILHAVGIKNELPEATNNYRPMPYFHDMAAIYASADLLITRSGAVTCSELTSVGKYAILVPLPHGNGEQFDNAKALSLNGAATLVRDSDFNAAWLSFNIDEAIQKALHFAPKQIGANSDAAKRIAELAMQVLHD